MVILYRLLSCFLGFITLCSVTFLGFGIFTDDSDGKSLAIIILIIIVSLFAWGTRKAWRKAEYLDDIDTFGTDEYSNIKKASKNTNKKKKSPSKNRNNTAATTSTLDITPASQYSFDYTDSKGDHSSRTVIYRSVTQHEFNNHIYLNGICTDKHANRKFTAENMRNLVNLDTGECISDAFDYFEAIYENETIYSELKRG